MGATGARMKASFTANVGPRGLFVRMLSPPQHGTRVDMLLHLPDDSSIEVQGVVRWGHVAPRYATTNQSGCGVELVNPPANWIEYIRGLG
jgi:hypothetical protein